MQNWILILTVLSAGFWSCDKSDSNSSPTETETNKEWQLVWQDEFDGTSLDLNKWNYDIGASGWGNNELQYYTSERTNAYVQSGNLVVEARKEKYQGSDYTSARLTTREKGDWKYGKFEIRARLPKGQGIWPAIWMLPTDWTYGGWAASGEIDIMELIGSEPKKVHGTLHYGGESPQNVHSGIAYELTDFSEDFHVFTLEWYADSIKWFVDDVHYQTQTEWFTTGGEFPAPFDQRFHLLLNIAVGGNWPGYPDATTIFPQRMLVDYVRVYQFPPTK